MLNSAEITRLDQTGDMTTLPGDQIVPEFAVHAVQALMPHLGQIVKGIALRHVVGVMSGINQEFKEWLIGREKQRIELQFAMIEISNELALLKAAAADKIQAREREQGRLADAVGASSSSASSSSQQKALPFGDREPQEVALPGQEVGQPPLDDFTKGLLAKIGGIVKESVKEQVNIAVSHANSEFEEWTQKSDERQAA